MNNYNPNPDENNNPVPPSVYDGNFPQNAPEPNYYGAPVQPQQQFGQGSPYPQQGYPAYQPQPQQPANGGYPTYPAYQQQQGYPMMSTPAMNSQGTSSGIVSLCISLASFLFLWVVPVLGVLASAAGVFFGHKGMKENPVGQYGNARGLSIAGLITGYLALAGSVLWTGFFLLVMVIGSSGA